MQEEFHGDGAGKYQILYQWNTLTANVWLPSLRELAGIDPNHYDDMRGCYYSAMQGINASTTAYVDAQGGTQFKYFQQFNASGGGEQVWACGGSEQFLLRSVRWDNTKSNWMMRDATYFHTPVCTASLAVHPAVLAKPLDFSKSCIYNKYNNRKSP